MEWRDDAIILGVRQHHETSTIVELMTRVHGRHLGVVKGGRARCMQPLMQPGNCVAVYWWARLEEHMGKFRLEAMDFSAARIMQIPFALYSLQTVAAHLRLLPERDPYPVLYEALQLLLEHFAIPLLAAEILMRFEMRLLEELGFGLDLTCCAVTGIREDLAYVSPKSARAVSRSAGLPWKERLLILPSFLYQPDSHPASSDDIRNGFRLTGFFLARHVWEPCGLTPPSFRNRLIKQLLGDVVFL
ncbi:MAG: DNA repair protein RecO (recombination protein O) [Candidatus Tokpelaia sp. JSC189]|nr:MAG: DNA repair protein RecO (recombination protein O) [Candidatus Tokpelaia sp. JSC189]